MIPQTLRSFRQNNLPTAGRDSFAHWLAPTNHKDRGGCHSSKKVLEYTGEYRKTTHTAIVVPLVGIIMNVLSFLFVYQIIRPLLMREPMTAEYVIWRTATIAVCALLYAVFYVWGLSLSHRSAYNTLKNLRISLQGKLEKQPLGAIQEKGVGVIKKMSIDDIETIELPLAHTPPEGIANLTILVLVFIGILLVDWKLTPLSLCSLPLGAIAMTVMYRIGMKDMGNYYAAAQKMDNTIVEYIDGTEVVKVFSRDGKSYHRFEGDVKSYRDFTLAWCKACWLWVALYSSILPCMALFAPPIGSYLVTQRYSTPPDLALVLCMSLGIGAPLLRALSFMSTLPQINYKIETLEQMPSAPPPQQSVEPFQGKDHSVRFEGAHFAYKDTEVLHGVSLEVPEDSLAALVGESGSGKSTLAKLLVHFYDVSGGSVKIDGQGIRSMSPEAPNDEISYVAQEQFLFNISLLENIRLGKLDATDEEVLTAIEKAQCGGFLARPEKDIHTMAGDGGKQLSGGERQRISLARAILKNAPIVALDEATASMDLENEERMDEAIAEVIRGKTVIIIAHRLRSIINADQICVLNNGNLTATGTHAQLLESCPEYQKPWQAAEGSAQWRANTAKGKDNA